MNERIYSSCQGKPCVQRDTPRGQGRGKQDLLDIGCTTAVIDGIEVAIYNRERCLCDAIKYRNKIGIDVMAEILNSYLSYPQNNLNILQQYAKELRVYKILSNYLYGKI